MPKSALIIGAGLGGLLCGQLLSRKGLKVTLLEADPVPGGILHTFNWDGIRCERGFHSAGGLGPGEPLEKLFRPLGLLDLPWYRADADEGFPFLRLNARTDYECEHIVGPFLKSVWRLKGGGETLIQALAQGLDIRCGKKVSSISQQTVYCEDGSSFQADVVISNLHPLHTLDILEDHIRPSYAHRLRKMENGADITTVYCRLQPGCVPWQSGAIFLDDTLMVHFAEPETGILELLCFGEANPEDMIARAAQRLPGLQVQAHLAVRHPGYGFIKHSSADFIAPVTPVPWLFLTGQNLGLHGLLGTTISAYNTCKSIEL
jgi:hypothetical protein